MQLILRLRSSRRPSKLPLILPTHLNLIPRPLSSLPEPTSSSLTHTTPVTNRTILRSIILLSTTPTTNHTVRPFINMFFSFIMAFVTCIYFLAAGESEPPIGFGVVSAAPAFGKLGAGLQAEGFLFAFWTGGRWEARGGGYSEEFDGGNLEGEFLVAFPADVAGGFALDGDDSRCWVDRRTL